MKVDTLISARWILPIAPDETAALSDHSIVIKDGKILDILPNEEAQQKYSPSNFLDRSNSVVLPGFINAHTHSGMALMRGCADDELLIKWLRETVWPIEQALVDPQFCEDGTMLAAAEMVRSGITCFSDMYFFPSSAISAATKSGMRAVIGLVFLQFPSAYASSEEDYFNRAEEIRLQFKDQDLIHFTYAPHAPYSVQPSTWLKLKELSKRNKIPIHTHLHETKEECASSLILDRSNFACHTSDKKCHPIQDMNENGLLNNRFVGAHMVHLTDDEIALCAEKRVHIVHCPTSNAKLASGFCPVHKLLKAGINVAIGTDSACSNNSLDMIAETKMSALLAKNLAGDATVVPAAMALRMATINGARAFGIDHLTGSLEVGKSADLICIDVETHPGNSPVYNPHSAVVYASSREDVTDVLVAGKFLLRDKLHCMINEKDVLRRVGHWREKVSKSMHHK